MVLEKKERNETQPMPELTSWYLQTTSPYPLTTLTVPQINRNLQVAKNEELSNVITQCADKMYIDPQRLSFVVRSSITGLLVVINVNSSETPESLQLGNQTIELTTSPITINFIRSDQQTLTKQYNVYQPMSSIFHDYADSIGKHLASLDFFMNGHRQVVGGSLATPKSLGLLKTIQIIVVPVVRKITINKENHHFNNVIPCSIDLNHDGRLSFEEFQHWYVTRCLCFAKLWLPSFVSDCVCTVVCCQLCVAK